MDLKQEIDLFFSEFSAVESQCVGEALRSMAPDQAFVERSEKMLDHHARFTLLKRMASVRNVSVEALTALEAADLRAAELREKRDALTHTLSSLTKPQPDSAPAARRLGKRTTIEVWVPTIDEIERCRTSTAKLQATLQAFTRQITEN
jgi:hypothetical protein